MKYFTRNLYKSCQRLGRSDKHQQAQLIWSETFDKYMQHLEVIKKSLPESMKEFCRVSLHDGMIKKVTVSKDKLVLEIMGDEIHSGPNGLIGIFQVIFTGVKSVRGINKIINDFWLYEEIHLSNIGKFEYHVLLDKSEFIVVADEVEFKEIKE